MIFHLRFLLALSFAGLAKYHYASAHFAAWHIGMYCLNGTVPGVEDLSHSSPANPLYDHKFEDWWFHHVDKCDEFPPNEGKFLELPANGQFTVELATNRAFTSLSFGGSNVGEFGNGQDQMDIPPREPDGSPGCITEPNIHTQNETMAAGTAFAISYQSEISQVTPDNLVVFTVLYNTPWRLIAIYDVPNLPACPEPKGCICAWGWVPNGCGVPNMYMQPFRCKVTGSTGSALLAMPKAPTWCEDNPSNCVQGAKQMIYWHQAERNNIETSGYDLAGMPRSPAYNAKCGYPNGAQNDIFLQDGTAEITSIQGTSTATVREGPSQTDTSNLAMRISYPGSFFHAWSLGLLVTALLLGDAAGQELVFIY